METTMPAQSAVDSRDSLLERAADLGFVLVSFVTPSGQAVWEWRRGDEPRPQFVTERVARRWMSQWLTNSQDLRPTQDLRSRDVPKHH